MCKVGATEVLERAAQEDNLDSPILKEDKSKDWALKVEDKEDEDEEIEDKAAKRKRAPSPDPLFERFTKKAKPEIIEEEKDEHGTEVIFDISDGEEVNAHDDEDDEAGFDIEEGEYGSDDGEEDGDDELEDDFEE
jgi:segregation and condensation protein B